MIIALGHSFMPHHEHGFEMHLSLNSSSDCSDNQAESATECVSPMDDAILLSKENSKCACGEHHEHFPIPVYTLLSLFLVEWVPKQDISQSEDWTSFYSNLHTSTFIPQSKGLRAPPIIDFSVES